MVVIWSHHPDICIEPPSIHHPWSRRQDLCPDPAGAGLVFHGCFGGLPKEAKLFSVWWNIGDRTLGSVG